MKNNLKESLNRTKLLMNYKTDKTLTENKQLITEIAPLAIVGLVAGAMAAQVGLISYISRATDENPDAAQSLRDFILTGRKAKEAGGEITAGYDPGKDAVALYTAMFDNDWMFSFSATEDEETIIRIITSLTSVVDLAALDQKYSYAYSGRDMVQDLEDSLQSAEWAPITLWIEKVKDELNAAKEVIKKEEKKEDGKKEDGKKEDGKKEDGKKEDGTVIIPPKRKWVDAPSCDSVSKGNGKIEFGMRGDCVETIQSKLNEKNQAGLAEDGKFGKLTKAAVVNFQTKNNISPADGIVDQKTITAIMTGSTEDLSYKDVEKFK
jgi:hypothetical protein